MRPRQRHRPPMPRSEFWVVSTVEACRRPGSDQRSSLSAWTLLWTNWYATWSGRSCTTPRRKSTRNVGHRRRWKKELRGETEVGDGQIDEDVIVLIRTSELVCCSLHCRYIQEPWHPTKQYATCAVLIRTLTTLTYWMHRKAMRISRGIFSRYNNLIFAALKCDEGLHCRLSPLTLTF